MRFTLSLSAIAYDLQLIAGAFEVSCFIQRSIIMDQPFGSNDRLLRGGGGALSLYDLQLLADEFWNGCSASVFYINGLTFWIDSEDRTRSFSVPRA